MENIDGNKVGVTSGQKRTNLLTTGATYSKPSLYCGKMLVMMINMLFSVLADHTLQIILYFSKRYVAWMKR